MSAVKLTYLGHACFCLEAEGFRTVLDPYRDGMIPGLPPLRVEAEAVFCSHQHDDHNYLPAVTLTGREQEPPYTVTELEVPHDDQGGSLRGMNTIRCFQFPGLRVVHLGDLGRLLTEQEARTLAGADCLLIPVGGYYTIDSRQAKQVIAQLSPRVIIPMHYRTDRTGFAQISRLEDFTAQFSAVRFGGSSLLLDAQTPGGVTVLTPEALKQETNENFK